MIVSTTGSISPPFALAALAAWVWPFRHIVRFIRWNIEYYNFNLQSLKANLDRTNDQLVKPGDLSLKDYGDLTKEEEERRDKIGGEIDPVVDTIMLYWGIGAGLFLIYHVLEIWLRYPT